MFHVGHPMGQMPRVMTKQFSQNPLQLNVGMDLVD